MAETVEKQGAEFYSVFDPGLPLHIIPRVGFIYIAVSVPRLVRSKPCPFEWFARGGGTSRCHR